MLRAVWPWLVTGGAASWLLGGWLLGGCSAAGSMAVAGAGRALAADAAHDAAVPGRCTPEVNARLAGLLGSPTQRGPAGNSVDNVMVCGLTVSSSRTQHGGEHGDHEILPLRVTLPGGEVRLVEVVINDDLDGRVTAPVNVPVFAYGQAFFPRGGRFVAGIHDVHCATHRGADNGWVVVNGDKHPASCPPQWRH